MKGVENPKDPIEAMPSDTATSTASSVNPTSIALALNTACEVSNASAIATKSNLAIEHDRGCELRSS